MHYRDNLNPMPMLLYIIMIRQSHGMLHVVGLSFLIVIKNIFPLNMDISCSVIRRMQNIKLVNYNIRFKMKFQSNHDI